MAVTLTPHQRALLQLLPDGLAWDKRPSSVLAALCLGLSHSTERVSWTGNQMLAERFPDSSRLLLEDWERYLGLPECDMTGAKPSLNREFYIRFAAEFGYEIDIQPSPDSQWVSIVTINSETGYRNMNVLDDILTPLRIYEGGALECILNRYKPAWQTFIYVYANSHEEETI